MENKFVLTVAMDGVSGQTNILFGNAIDLPEKTESGSIIKVQLGGGLSLPIMLNMFLTAFRTMKDQVMSNPNLKEKDKPLMEQEIYDMLNIAVGSYLDKGFPYVNAAACLTEEACVEYGLDPKTANPDDIITAENKFIEEHPDRASKTFEMKLEKPTPHNGSNGGPNREQRRKTAKEKRS